MTDSVQEITAMVHRYCELVDAGDFESFARLFDHGVWHKAPPGEVHSYLEGHVLLYDGVPRTKHVTTNLVIDVDESDRTATASSYVTVFQALPDFPLQAIFAGRYHDRFERVDGVWRWRERQIISDLRGDTSRHTKAPERA